jgi:hypothetical protein
LIDVLASEGAISAPYIFEDTFNHADKSFKFVIATQAMVLLTTLAGNVAVLDVGNSWF